MNVDLEDLGALGTATLAAHELEGAQAGAPAGPTEAPAQAHICANCGATVAGAYCQACGQAAHLHSSLLHLVEETLHGVLHFDTKAWRTLPMLVTQPGVLTRRYIAGQRMRFVSPLALFLFTMFLMFFAFGFIHVEVNSGANGFNSDPVAERAAHAKELADAKQELAKDLADAQQALTVATAKLEQAQRTGQGVSDARDKLVEAKTELGVAETVHKAVSAAPASSASGAAPANWRAQLAAYKVNTGYPTLDELLKGPQHNPDLYLYKLKNTAYKFSFLLIPISLPFLWLLFLGRPGATMFGHAVFSLYSLSFMAVLFVLLTLLSLVGWDAVAGWLLVVGVPLHMFVHTRQAYALGLLGAAWRVLALLAVAGTTFLVFMTAVLLMAAR